MLHFMSIGTLVLILYASPTRGTSCPKVDGEFAVHIPHETDCSRFYKCDRGTPVLQYCNAGLHFNARLEVCDWPEWAGCEPGTGTTTESTGDCDGGTTTCPGNTTPQTPDENWVGDCPEENDGDAIHLPHATDCTKFYKCDWGVAVLFDCPSGLHFNSKLEVCDWPAAAGCEAGTDNGGNGSTEGNGGDDCNGCSTEPTPDEDGGSKPDEGGGSNPDEDGGSNPDEDGGNWVGDCPKDNDGDVVHLPHETDCTKFYKCDWGVAVPFDCPPGLHFNSKLEVCDWPAAAGCEPGTDNGGNGSTEGNGGDDCNGCSTEPTPDEDGGTNPDEDGGSNPDEDGGNWVGDCPKDNDGDVVHLPHETDCTKFYKCDWGVAIPFDCPPGLHFNSKLEVCDWPAAAGCEPGSDNGGNGSTEGNGGDDCNGCSTEPTPDEDGGSNPDEDGGTNPDEDGGSNPDEDGGNWVGDCPKDNDGDVVHLPHETDCTKFYKCDWGVAVPFDCPPGLHFNRVLQVCDWPADAGCEPGSDNGGSGSTEGNGGDDCNNGCSTEPTPDEDGGNNPDEDGGTNPDEGGGTNPDEDGGTNPDEDGGTNPDEGGGSNPDEDGGNWVGDCPKDNDGDVVHLPHETDCTKFYKCDWGVAIPFDCPSGLHFNKVLQVCDWPADAGCEPGSDNGGSGSTEGNGGDDCNNGCSTEPTPDEDGGSNPDEDGGTNPDEDGGTNPDEDGGNWVGVCPKDNDGDVVHLPHETDCTKFYKCDWGVAIPFDCPPGLHFNRVLQVCDWPADAGCEPGSDNGGSGSTEGNGGDDCNNGCSTEPTPDEDGGSNPDEDGGTNPDEDGGTNPDEGGGTNPDEDGGSKPDEDGGNWVGVCPKDNDGDVVHLPHETDCTKFYKCDWGVAIPFDCPPGLHFNRVLQVCDWPADAGCEPGSDNGGSGSTEGNGGDDCNNGCSTEPTPDEDGGSNPDEDGGTNPDEDGGTNPDEGGGTNPDEDGGSKPDEDGGNWVGVCPKDNDGDVVHLPHETDCTKFYKCDWGVAIPFDCPPGLHFNRELQVCDWPADAGCEPGSDNGGSGSTEGNGGDDCNNGCSTEPTPDEDGGSNPDEDGGTNPDEDGGTNPDEGGGTNPDEDGGSKPDEDGGNWVGVCPKDNDGDVVHLPHETDCTKFYKCDWGVAIPFDCPPGLHFNRELQVCDWPADAGCEPGSDNGGSGSTEGNGGDDCNNGCSTEPTPDEDGGTNPDEGGGTNPDEDGGSKPDEDGGNWVGDCPKDNDGDVVHLPHETDCTKFYKCDWGVAIPFDCPPGLHFNRELQVCDWPADAGCEPGSDNGGSGSTEGNGGDDCNNGCSTEPTPDEDGGSNPDEDGGNKPDEDGGNWVGDCPKDNDGDVVHLPHETDCTKFYKCDWGVAIPFDCPPGLHFNRVLQVCDWPADAGCEPGGDNGGSGSTEGNGGDDCGGCTTDGGDNGGTEEPTKPDEPSTDGNQGYCVRLACPELNGRYVYFLPYLNDCTRFCKCDWGTPYEYDCPPGLHFNTDLEVCDFPEKANCTV